MTVAHAVHKSKFEFSRPFGLSLLWSYKLAKISRKNEKLAQVHIVFSTCVLLFFTKETGYNSKQTYYIIHIMGDPKKAAVELSARGGETFVNVCCFIPNCKIILFLKCHHHYLVVFVMYLLTYDFRSITIKHLMQPVRY